MDRVGNDYDKAFRITQLENLRKTMTSATGPFRRSRRCNIMSEIEG